jgi:hypothetical protein
MPQLASAACLSQQPANALHMLACLLMLLVVVVVLLLP